MEREMNFFELCRACFRALWKGLCVCAQFLGIVIRLCFRKWWIVLPVIIVALVVANYYARRDNRIYKAEAVVWLNGPSVELTERVYKNLVHAVPAYISETQNLHALLGLSYEQLDGVRNFDALPVIDCLRDSVADYIDYHKSSSPEDTVNVRMPNRLCLTFQTKRPNNVKVVGEAVINYLNSNPQMQAAYAHKCKVLGRELKFAEDHVEKLDSLTSAFYFEQGVGQQAQASPWRNGMVLGRREIIFFQDEINREFRTYDKLDYQAAFCTAPVVVEDHFTINPVALNGRIKMNVIGLLIGWIIGCLLAALIEQRKTILAWLRN